MEFLDCYKEALEIQLQRQQEENEELSKASLDEREARGYSLLNVSVRFEFYNGEPDPYCAPLPDGMRYIKYAYVSCRENYSKFRESSMVFLKHGSYCFPLEVMVDAPDRMVLAPSDFDRKVCFIDPDSAPENNWTVDDRPTDITYKLLLSTWDFLNSHPDKAAAIAEVLEGRSPQQSIPASIAAPPTGRQPNPSQQEAIARAVGCEPFHMIQGPPGTGKTFTIGHICRHLIAAGCKVLVTGPTHTAINNCLNAVACVVNDDSKVVKLGKAPQAAELDADAAVARKTRLPYNTYLRTSTLSKEGIVIGATPYALANGLAGWDFDYAVVDESSQLSIPQAVTVMAHSDRVVFVGDHKQLDPIIPRDTDNWMLEHSIFQHMVKRYPGECSLLRESYRLNENLIRIPNELFYHNELVSCAPVEMPFVHYQMQERYMSEAYPEVAELIQHASNELLYLHEEFDAQGRSPYEAELTARLILQLMLNKVKPQEIAVVTPYRAQVREVKLYLSRWVFKKDSPLEKLLFVDTVDRMQGQEKEYIIYTLANSNPESVERRMDFFFSPNRLNVAITRARTKCIVIGNYLLFDLCRQWLEDPLRPAEMREGIQAYVDFYDRSTRLTQQVQRAEDIFG